MFKGYRLAFFDYDRTLFAHQHPFAGEPITTYEEECYNELINQEKLYERDQDVPAMKWAIDLLHGYGAVTYVLTHEIFNLRDDIKSTRAMEVYGIRNYLTTDSAAHKIDMIKAVAKRHGVKLSECLFVDDKMDIILLACENGISGVHTSNICATYEKSLQE